MSQRAVRDFSKKSLAHARREIDQMECIPPEIIEGMAEMGLLTQLVAEEYGGAAAAWTMDRKYKQGEAARFDIALAAAMAELRESRGG